MLEPHSNHTNPVRYATEFDYCEICLKKAMANNTEKKNIFQLRKALEGKNQGQKVLALRHYVICPKCMQEIVQNMNLLPELIAQQEAADEKPSKAKGKKDGNK